METDILRLNMLNPLFYVKDESIDLGFRQEDVEKVYCFEIEKPYAYEFEPEKRHFPGSLIFVGKKAAEDPEKANLELPRGNYIFCQIREILNQEEIVELAVEVQNEGLWQRLKLTDRLYLRFLFEDGRGVTQVWRPYIS